MSNSEQIYQRVVETLNFILSKGDIKNQSDLGIKLGLKAAGISGMMKGRTKPTFGHIIILVSEYQINPNFIFFGIKPIQISKEKVKTHALLTNISDRLRVLVNDLEKEGY